LIFMVAVHQNYKRIIDGFRLLDTNTFRTRDIEYNKLFKSIKSGKESVRNLVIRDKMPSRHCGYSYTYEFPDIENEVIDELRGVIERYPVIRNGEVIFGNMLVIIGVDSTDKSLVCVDEVGGKHFVKHRHMDGYKSNGIGFANEYIIDGNMECIESGTPDEVARNIEKYNMKCELLGLDVPFIKYIDGNVTLISSDKNAENIIIPSFVTHIGKYAFKGCNSLKELKIPLSVKHIGAEAFSCCESLKNMYIPKSVVDIENDVFTHSGIVNITIDSNIRYIPKAMFRRCFDLRSIKIRDTVEYIKDRAFIGCGELESIEIIENSTGVRGRVALPSRLKYIGVEAFLGCMSLDKLHMPDSVTEVRERAFTTCVDIRDIKISKKLTKLEKNVFEDCSIESIVIPENIKEIEDEAFKFCGNLSKVKIEGMDTKIAERAFYLCKSLRHVELADGSLMNIRIHG